LPDSDRTACGVAVSEPQEGQSMSKPGTVYLIHLGKPLAHARHYLGFTDDLDARLERHRAGNGARLMSVISAAGITWQCVRTWQGDRKLERQLKRRKEAPALCVICSGEAALKRAANYHSKRKAVK